MPRKENGYNGIEQGKHSWAFCEKCGQASLPRLYTFSKFCVRPSQVCRLEHVVCCKRSTRRELTYTVTSLSPAEASPERLLALWPVHWGIENRVHWVRDVTFDEDRSQASTGSAPQIMAALRNLTIGMFRLAGETNIAAALRRYAVHPSHPLTLIGAPLK